MTTKEHREKEPSHTDAMLKGLGIGCAVLALIMPGHASQKRATQAKAPAVVTAKLVQPHEAPHLLRADFGVEAASDEARETANWAVYSGDTQGMPFVIVDKKHATVHVFSRDGKLQGSTPVLLGSAIGDDSVHGIGEREISDIKPHERTTPSGRFVTTPGRNSFNEDIVWVDYDAAVSMHRVRPKVASERRLERLASATTEDNRISFGCINVPIKFYNAMIHPVLGTARGVVYVLPETRTAREEFGSYAVPDLPGVSTAAQTAIQSR